MKKVLFYILSVLSVSGCLTVTSQEEPSDRIGEMEYYARFKVYREVQETVRYLAMACRLDEYTNLSEQEKRASIWNDIRGNVFVNGDGVIKLADYASYETGKMRLGEETAEWKVRNTYADMSFICSGPSSWVCSMVYSKAVENALVAVLKDKEHGIWTLGYDSTETEGEHKAVFSSEGLEATYIPRYEQYYTTTITDSPVLLTGKVTVLFYESGEQVDWLVMEWSGSSEPVSVRTSRNTVT